MLNANQNDSSDDEQSSLLRNQIDSSTNASRQNSVQRRSSGYLNEATKSQRFRDIRICYFGMFISSIVFSITVASLWPYLHSMDDKCDTSFLGAVVASFSIGQLISSPILGYIANKTNNNKMPLVFSTALIAIANVLYSYVQSIPSNQKWWLLVARFIMGVGSGNSAVMRSYASAATTLTERTSVMANMSASQGIGFILGPLIQAVFALIDKLFNIKSKWFPFNIYTAPGYFSALTAAVNVVLFLVSFRDVRAVSAPRKSINGDDSIDLKKKKEIHDQEQDQFLALLCCFYMFFVAYLTFTNYEVIGSPLSIDMYAWNNKQSTLYNGILLGSLGVMSVGILIGTKILAKRYQDRTLLFAGMIICFIGYFIFLPWGHDYPSSQIATVSTARPPTVTTSPVNHTTTTTTTNPSPTTTTVPDGVGCPLDYDWCQDVPIVQLWQYILASIIITTGFSISNVICYSIFSKKLGNRPQGTMMGIMNSVGAGARAVGPISVGYIYAHDGPRVMFIFMLVVLVTSIVTIIFNYRRLYIEPEPPETVENDIEQGESTVNGNGGGQINRHDDSED